MSKVALNVVLEFNPGSKQELLRSLLAHRERCLKEEPGTLQFEVMVPFEERSKIFLFELYADDPALSAHSAGSSLARHREEVKDLILNAAVHKCSLGNETTL
jgi:(4S)-4-hydroxy-5-phosphonooxypentane-2,3-dione isomerase